MPSLDDLTQLYIDKNLIPGQILHLFCNFTDPPKNKFALVVSTNPLILAFLVNSKVNNYVQLRGELLALQIQIKKCDYPFLDHDSYIACHNIIEDFSREEIVTQLKANIHNIIGMIKPTTKQQIITAIKASTIYDQEQVDIIVNSLK